MSTREPTKCPLCQHDGAVVLSVSMINRRDVTRIQCPRCGTFSIDGSLGGTIANSLGDNLYLISYATRNASHNGKEVTIDSLETAEALAASAPRWRTADDGVGRLLLSLTKKSKRYMAQITPAPENDYPLVPVRNAADYGDLWSLAAEMGLIDRQYNRITPNGWRRIEKLQEASALTRQAFVAMWFDPELMDAWLSGFKPGIERSNYFTALRIDAKEFNNKVDDQIIAEIRRSGLVVADFSGHRGGVYFEAGFAMGLGLPLIWTCRNADVKALHFDTRQYNHIIWDSPAELSDKIDRRIRATILPVVGAQS